jgi:CSLREA domain-containing protein
VIRAAVVAALLLLAAPATASATAYVVNTTADGSDGACQQPPDGDCSLREALITATSADSVSLPKGVYNLSVRLNELDVVGDTLNGAGARSTIIDGGGATRVIAASDDSTPSGNVSPQINGVTIRNGNAAGTTSTNIGGGIQVSFGTLGLANSAVLDNTAETNGGGIGMTSGSSLVMVGSTVVGNKSTGGRGGGIFSANEAQQVRVVNSTISGNSSLFEGAAYFGGGGSGIDLLNSTIAGNQSEAGIDGVRLGSNSTFRNAIIAASSGAACSALASTITSNNTLVSDKSCGLTGTGDLQGVDPGLGPLADNGGQTDTQAIAASSPALDGGGAGCQKTDQRGVSRPQLAACDIGAFEYRAPTLKLVTHVVNDDLGPLTADQVQVHVRLGGVDVKGSPAPGLEAGRTYTLVAGNAYTVDAEDVFGYTLSYSAGCNVTLNEGDASTCTVTADDVAPTLKVVTTVVNDDGGTKTTSDFNAHVRQGATDVPGSPQPGGAGTIYTLSPGDYAVSADGQPGYSASVTGDCDPNGAVTLAVGDVATCTITLDDGAPTLDVVTTVVNDDGGTKTPANFVVHVLFGLTDVAGSPQLGDPLGTTYSLTAGRTYRVAPGAVSGYTLAITGDCTATGAVALGLGDAKRCTVTANDVAPRLKVVTTVVNDDGGTKTPAAFSVHVRKGGADVAGSPKPGSAGGTTYTLKAGTYTVGAGADSGYTAAIAGACSANGAVSLQAGQAKTCTVTENDKAVKAPLPPPKPGKNVNALPAPTGVVLIKLPGTDEFVPLQEGEQVPLGTIFNVKNGRVTLVALPDGKATADFYGGIFKLGQTKGKKPITQLTLVEKLSCKGAGKTASAARKKKRRRRLWGDGKGRFRTKGSFSSATVRGTKWLVQDTCTTTTTRVARGKVAVRDFVKKKTVLVKAGHKYVARKRT